ncbi:MAG: GNAT family N-acetyltransferase [Thermoanaerobacterales bacterium]|jgi:predicted GNAT family acetyltransferase|nr:N-acetyltransferase [Thermoanaerobacterales bacterium]
MTDETVEVHDDPGRHRYEVTVGGEVAGFVAYEDRGDVRVLTHTEVDDRFEGRGLGSRLARGALDDVRRSGRRMVALCPFVARYVERHPEYADLVDPGADAELRAGDRAR